MITFDNKYTVVKDEDLANALTFEEVQQFGSLINRVREYRLSQGKAPSNQYLVINTDEPYAFDVARILKRHGHYNREDRGQIQVDLIGASVYGRLTLKQKFEEEVISRANIGRMFQYLVVAVKLPTGAVELIVNTDRILEKAQYYASAYDDYFQLRSNPMVQVVDYMIL